MNELIITRGLPGSGKSTWAKAWVAEDELKRARINRDDYRQMMYGKDAPLPYELEVAISAAQQNAVRGLLLGNFSVVVDDMHLRQKYIKQWQLIAQECGASFSVQDFTDVDVETCIVRDEKRGRVGHRFVSEEVIRELHAGLQSSLKQEARDRNKTIAPVADEEYRYKPNLDLYPAWIVDIDGTLAHMDGRGPFEWHRVGEDSLNPAVYEIVASLAKAYDIIIMSGRDEVCRQETHDWLNSHLIPYQGLVMRPEGDSRKDSVVKLELFREHVEPYYHVVGVLDDRQQVVDMWRRIGLFCAQVAPGQF